MKILVTGVGGQLGYDVCRRLTQLGIEHKGVDVQDFDLTNADAVMDAVRAYAPDAIIHCAAYTNVEKAESMPEVCADVNGMGTLNMVRAALAVQAKLMYISTDYVFEGTGDHQGPGGGGRAQPDATVLHCAHQLGFRGERAQLCAHHAAPGRGEKGNHRGG